MTTVNQPPVRSPTSGKAANLESAPRLTAAIANAPALPQGFDAVTASAKAPDLDGAPLARGGPVPLMLGPVVLNLGKARRVSEAKKLELDLASEAGRLRAKTLGTTGSAAHYEERTAEYATHGGGGSFFPRARSAMATPPAGAARA